MGQNFEQAVYVFFFFFFSVKASLRHTPKRTQRENTDTSDTHVHVHVGEETGRPEGQQASRRCARPTGAERADGLAREQRPRNRARQRAGAGGATRVARTRREGPGRAGTCCSGRAGRQHRRRGRQRGDRPIARWGRGSRRLAQATDRSRLPCTRRTHRRQATPTAAPAGRAAGAAGLRPERPHPVPGGSHWEHQSQQSLA